MDAPRERDPLLALHLPRPPRQICQSRIQLRPELHTTAGLHLIFLGLGVCETIVSIRLRNDDRFRLAGSEQLRVWYRHAPV